MAAYGDLMERVKALSACFKWKKDLPIPQDALTRMIAALDGLLKDIRPYLPLTKNEQQERAAAGKRRAQEERTAAMWHPISAQIVNFTDATERKKMFDSNYFQRRFDALPADRNTVAPAKVTRASLREAIILYYFKRARGDHERALRELRMTIENDYKSHPAVKKATEATELLRRLLSMEDVKDVAAILEKQFPSETALKDFAKTVNLKIPPAKRAKKAPRTTAHERLAESIHTAGGYARV
jgi:hypothetical protein